MCTRLCSLRFLQRLLTQGSSRFKNQLALLRKIRARLIGHWRKTTIGYTGPVDEHLVLHSNGTVENWTVTAYERREPVTGHWSVEGKTADIIVRWQRPLQPVHLLPGPTRFPKYSEPPRILGKDRIVRLSFALRGGKNGTRRRVRIAVKFEIGSFFGDHRTNLHTHVVWR